MKIKQCLVSSLALFLSVSAFSAYAAGDSDSDTQEVTVIVPEVSLIDVSGDLNVKLTAPTEAGENFKDTVVEGKPLYDISANIAASAPKSSKKITAQLKDIPAGWKVTINKMEAPEGAKSLENVVLNAESGSDTVTGIQNVAHKGLGIQLSVGPKNDNIMPSYTSDEGMSIGIVYTITAAR